MQILRIFISDTIKAKHSILHVLAAVLPILYTSIILWYVRIFTNSPKSFAFIYGIFFELGGILLPLAIGLFAALICKNEEEAGNFRNILLSPLSRRMMLISKCLLIMKYVVSLVVGATLLLSVALLIKGFDTYSIVILILGGITVVVSSIPLCLIYLFLSFKFDMGVSLGVGAFGILIGAVIGTTTMGEHIWQLIPWAWPVKMADIIMLRIPEMRMPNGYQAEQVIMQQFIKGSISVIIATIIGMLLFIHWFNKFEGRKSEE